MCLISILSNYLTGRLCWWILQTVLVEKLTNVCCTDMLVGPARFGKHTKRRLEKAVSSVKIYLVKGSVLKEKLLREQVNATHTDEEEEEKPE